MVSVTQVMTTTDPFTMGKDVAKPSSAPTCPLTSHHRENLHHLRQRANASKTRESISGSMNNDISMNQSSMRRGSQRANPSRTRESMSGSMNNDVSMSHSSLRRGSFHGRRRASSIRGGVEDVSLDLTNATRASILSHASSANTRSSSDNSGWGGNSSASLSTLGGCSVKFFANQFINHQHNNQSDEDGDDSSSCRLTSHYQVGDLLGEGGYGDVFAATHIQSGADRAVKVIEKEDLQTESPSSVLEEFSILKELDHPNVLKVYELFEDETNYYIVTDIIEGGELYDELGTLGTLHEEEAQVLMNTILSALNYCHKRKLVHRDLKPENILLEQSGDYANAKVIDFGLAKRIPASTSNHHHHHHDEYDIDDSNVIPVDEQPLTGREGSCYYVSPQVINGSYSEKCDVWSAGVICYVILSGFAPFDGEAETDIHQEILKHNYDFNWDEWDDISDQAKDFVSYLLTYDEAERPSAEQALQHPWLQEHRRISFGSDAETRRSTRESLCDLRTFHTANCKLKQATCAFIASQLINKQEQTEQTGGLDAVFRNLDAGCNGNLSREDVRQRYQDLFQVDLAEEDITQLFLEVNFSGSGRIEYSEFVIAQLLARNAIGEETIRAAFRYFDNADKGYITTDDLKERLHLVDYEGFGADCDDDNKGAILDKYIARKILAPVDANGDGLIDYDEFKTMLLSRNARRISLRRSSSRRSVTEYHRLSLNNSAITELEEDWSESESNQDD